MREIIFRGKQVDGGEWISGDLRHWDNGKVGIHNDALRCTLVVIPETVGQYTGLKDRNGRRIFEGDIIQYAERCEYDCYWESIEHPEEYEGIDTQSWLARSAIEWCGENDYPAFDIEPHDFETNGLSWIINDDFVIEVIGNIHDNPEILK